MSIRHYLIAGIILSAGVIGCAANQQAQVEKEPSKDPPYTVQMVSHYNSPYVTIVDLMDGRKVLAFGYYSQNKDAVVIAVEPDQVRLLYSPTHPPVNPPITLLPVVTNANK